MTRSLIGWDGAGGGYFERPDEPPPDDVEPEGQGPPVAYVEVGVWCGRCGLPRRETATCVACGDET